jgi:hypothetical protein
MSRLMAYMESPELGRHVRTFSANRIYAFNPTLRSVDFSWRTTDPCENRIIQVCDSMAEFDAWMSALRHKDWKAMAALLLTCMPRLESIKFEPYDVLSISPINYVLSHAAKLQSQGDISAFSLHSLKKVVIGAFDSSTSVTLDPALLFIKLESIKSARFVGLEILSNSNASSDLELDHLTIVDCSFSEYQLTSFLKRFKNLSSFSLVHSDVLGDHVFLPQKVGEAISHLKDSLKTLEVITFGLVDVAMGVRGAIGSLKEYRKLRLLSLSCEVLFGPLHPSLADLRPKLVDVLPESLLGLELLQKDLTVINQLIVFLGRKNQPPNLSRIKLEGNVPAVFGYQDHLTSGVKSMPELEAACEEVGIKLNDYAD